MSQAASLELQPLEKRLRGKLEQTVKQAREVAEEAAEAACRQLGVGLAKADPHLTTDERDLRRRLRIHGRQLGDALDRDKETQQLDRLVEEIAYQHWHRMLFARFLAENHLLMYPDPDDPVAVSLEDCEELAADEGAKNGWELAARFAAKMLPQIFRIDSPVFDLTLPPEKQQRLEQLLAGLPDEVFAASDSLGWVYQFWQAKRKDAVNASEVKIGARELPAVTQLFTEPYMVAFLLDNTLGAWHASKVLAARRDLAETAVSEEEVRRAVSIPGCSWEYLRLTKDVDNRWQPAAGKFENWPCRESELKCLDPCMGSGHFIVAMFTRLVAMRVANEKLDEQSAVEAVIRENLFGLEIDANCTQIAAFNLALAAWRRVGYCVLPSMNLACSGLAPNAKKSDWMALARGNQKLQSGMERLHEAFAQAPTLGSLIDPESDNGDLLTSSFHELRPLLEEALNQESEDTSTKEMAVVAYGLAKAAEILSDRFNLVATNFPFLGLENQSSDLGEYLKEHFEMSKRELATCFLVRSSYWCGDSGTNAVVMPGEWTYARPHRHFRKWLLNCCELNVVCNLGNNSFATPLRVKPVLIIAQWTHSNSPASVIDVRDAALIDKGPGCASRPIDLVRQSTWRSVPDARLVTDDNFANATERVSDHADAKLGVGVGDGTRFERLFWELPTLNQDWRLLLGPSPDNRHYFGRHAVIYWQQEKGDIYQLAQSVKHLNHAAQNWQRGRPFWGRNGVLLSQMGGFTIYTGEIFDGSCLVVMPNEDVTLPALVAYAISGSYKKTISKYEDVFRIASPKSVISAPFDYAHWRQIGEEEFPHGLPMPYSNHPTQWIFHGHPRGTVIWDEDAKWTSHGPQRTDDTVLQVAVARLLGYRWPAELDPEMELADEQREWVGRCDELLQFADADGIVCIPSVRGEATASDRLLNLLAAAYGDAWSSDIVARLLAASDHAGKTLETWLRDKFFTQHCKLFQHRSFIWQIWDGLKDGFSVLVNYHRLDNKTLESLIYSYLNDWINRQKHDRDAGVDGSEEKLAAAESLKLKLEKILEGESPHDIFVRWKPLEEQPIGWNPDLNDGVRLNIRPFLSVGDVKKRGAGVLRDKPNIHWNKDRGKDVESAPWYHLGPQYGGKLGDRINEHHVTLAEKQAARQQQAESKEKF